MKLFSTILLFVFFVVIAVSFTQQNFSPKRIAFIVPKGWPKPVYDFEKNPITEEGFALGKKLFYDARLSKDGNISCGSCHQQFAAFATYEHNLSHGIANSFTTRNAPALQNLAWTKDFMWDGGINHLDVQPLAPLTNEHEMGETVEHVIAKLKDDIAYKKLFAAAFGDEKITAKKMMQALSQFMLMMVSSNSKYDKVMRGEAEFILPEKLGYEIFQKKCVACHTEPLFTDFTYRNVGIPMDNILKDSGRMKISGDRNDSLKFRVPSLRNIALTAPYGHDGRFFDLLNVFEHYRKNMQPIFNTDPVFKNKMALSNFEIGQLKAFLYTLTDSTFIRDARFAEPGNEGNFKAPVDFHQ
jgi:cytochrome c peroxidase